MELVVHFAVGDLGSTMPLGSWIVLRGSVTWRRRTMSPRTSRRYVSNGLWIVVDIHATSWRCLSPTPKHRFLVGGVFSFYREGPGCGGVLALWQTSCHNRTVGTHYKTQSRSLLELLA